MKGRKVRDDRTPEEKRREWVAAVVKVTAAGWQHITGWVFQSPSGTQHDLSATNLDMLDYIEANGCELVAT